MTLQKCRTPALKHSINTIIDILALEPYLIVR